MSNSSNILQKEQDDYTTAIRGNKGKGARISPGRKRRKTTIFDIHGN